MSGPRTVLVLDDEPQLLRLVERVLTRAGLRVLAAAEAGEALRLFEGAVREVDLVLLDVVLPGGQGAAELLPRLLAQRPDLEVIVTSGDDLPAGLEAELAAAGGRFLRKPFVPRTLLRLVGAEASEAARRPAAPPAPGAA